MGSLPVAVTGTSLATVNRNDNGQKVVLTYGGFGGAGHYDQVKFLHYIK